jgi:hypothetical protein
MSISRTNAPKPALAGDKALSDYTALERFLPHSFSADLGQTDR